MNAKLAIDRLSQHALTEKIVSAVNGGVYTSRSRISFWFGVCMEQQDL